MSKELKALDHIKTYARLDACQRCQYYKNGNCENHIGKCMWKDEIKIIETALKKLALITKHKNKVTIYTGCGKDKEKIEIFNFKSINHKYIDGKSYIEITALNGQSVYFLSVISVISSVEILENYP